MSTDTSSRFSIEFFPPRTEAGQEKLRMVHQELATLKPSFFSVTYGAGGSTRDGTRQAVSAIQAAGSDVAPHLSFGGSSSDDIEALLQDYKQAGIKRLVALRGDLPSGTGSTARYFYANELIEFVRKTTGDHFHIDVACYPEVHPQSESYDSDIYFFKKKVDAGANGAITQYFYNADAYFYYVDACQQAGIDIPIVPGIMPITNYANLQRFSNSCGAEIPRWIRQRLQAYGDDSVSIRNFGADVVLDLCEKLLAGGAPGLHFYSMNKVEPVRQIWQALEQGR